MQQVHPTLLHLIRQRSADTPDARALVHEASNAPAREVSYGELWSNASVAATQIGDRTKQGDRVVLLFPSGPEFVDAFLGCVLARRIAVPAAVPRNERAFERTVAIVRDSGARLIVTTGSMLLKLQAMLHGVSFPDGEAPAIVAVEPANSHERDDVECAPDDIAFLQYTSGSTAHPKGVMVTHDNLSDNLRHIHERFGFSSSTSFVNWLPVYHDMGLIGGILASLYAGCSTVLMSPGEFIQRPIRWLELITQYGGTISGAPNFAYDACVGRIPEDRLGTLNLETWQVAFNGSEPVRGDTLQRFAEKFAPCGFDPQAIFPCYGLAEATLLVAGKGSRERCELKLDRSRLKQGRVVESDATEARTLVACGAPDETHELAIVNPDTLAPCSENETGEIWLSGRSVCEGYWNRKDETRTNFYAELQGVPDKRFLRTGDLGLLREGQLYVSGRLKNIVIVRGLNYACEDIEHLAQASHPAVGGAPCAAFGVEGVGGEELVIAQEISTPYLGDVDLARVASAIQESIVLHHGIRANHLILVQPRSLPRTTSGKLQRHRARALYLSGELPPVSDPDMSGVRSTPPPAQSRG